MIKQIKIGNKSSYDDFNVYIADRKTPNPKKKTIKESIPFSNITYDFSKLDGEIYYEEREVTYVFDIAEVSTELTEIEKQKIVDWLLNVFNEDIYDPYIPNYHFHGSYQDDSLEEDFEACTISVTFSCYPYKIANEKTIKQFNLVSGDNDITITNNSSHRILPTITTSESMIIKAGTTTYSIPAGTYTDDDFKLEKGDTVMTVTPTSSSATIKFEFVEEIL